jgi:hypothetical protein
MNLKASELSEAVINYRLVPSKENGDKLGALFHKIAQGIMQTFEKLVPEDDDDYQEITNRLAIHAFTRVPNFDVDKSERAFAYFTTCMLCMLRQEYRLTRKKIELNERYGQYLPPA